MEFVPNTGGLVEAKKTCERHIGPVVLGSIWLPPTIVLEKRGRRLRAKAARRVRSPAGGPTRSPTQLHVALGHWLETNALVFFLF